MMERQKAILVLPGIGATFKDDRGDFRLVMWEKVGVNTNYLAEALAILEALEVALEREWVNILIEFDFLAGIKAFGTVLWHVPRHVVLETKPKKLEKKCGVKGV
ncbi:hypothetical protein IFM89_030399 [Coptis chinensis]|uniref:RNase H type-1 domain-containing protein n=1 Tax=Coptis chinensis TaxID=261450 RepID=A0A835HU26_9MAGN|nr:hypothetical protein IFM89_030399 [Coptis chinensis]